MQDAGRPLRMDQHPLARGRPPLAVHTPQRPEFDRSNSRTGSTIDVLMGWLVFTAILGQAASFHKIYLFHIVLVLALAAATAITAPRPGTASMGTIGFFVASLAWFALGLLWTLDTVYTVLFIAYFGCGASIVGLMVYYIRGDSNRWTYLFKIACAAVAVDAGVAALQAGFEYHPPFSPYAPENLAALTEDFSASQVAELLDSPTGFHWNPNDFAVVMAMCLPFAFLTRKGFVYTLASALLIWLIYQSDSRGVLLAVGMMLLVCPLFLPVAAAVVTLKRVVLVCILGLLLAGVAALPSIRQTSVGQKIDDIVVNLNRYVSGNESEKGDSIGMRQQLILNGLSALHQSYGVGIGVGADKYVQEQMFVGHKELRSMHNFWVELTVGAGYHYALAFLLFYGGLIKKLYRLRADVRLPMKMRMYCGATACSMCGFVLGAISASSVVYILPQYLMYGFAIGLVDCARTHLRQHRLQRMPTPRTSAGSQAGNLPSFAQRKAA